MNILLNRHCQKWVIAFFVILCVSASGCLTLPKSPKISDPNTLKTTLPEYRDSQLVVWRKPGVTDDAMDKRALNFRAKYDPTSSRTFTRIKCTDCDNRLEVWTGTTVKIFISTEVASPATRPGGSGGGPSGEDDTLYYSLNFVVRLPIEQKPFPNQAYTVPAITSGLTPVTVAVFDTGVDPAITDGFTNIVESCKEGGERGWNFFDENMDIRDNYPAKHGTVVSKFIVDQIKENSSGNRINILPVKVFGADGSSDLFKILCGFSYAKNAGAKIINASFGYYYYDSVPPKILLEYVREVLTKYNILLVAAAGNQIPGEDERAIEAGVPHGSLRNLDYHHFYPGGLSDSLSNVYCVTTARLKPLAGISPSQNYSKTIVDIGTIADGSADFSFIHPFNNSPGLKGSSFATPIFTGKLASWYSTIKDRLNNKVSVLSKMMDNRVVLSNPPLLGEWIIEGRYIRK
jgi:hypothetical protein